MIIFDKFIPIEESKFVFRYNGIMIYHIESDNEYNGKYFYILKKTDDAVAINMEKIPDDIPIYLHETVTEAIYHGAHDILMELRNDYLNIEKQLNDYGDKLLASIDEIYCKSSLNIRELRDEEKEV